MDSNTIIVLAVLCVMIVLFVSGKFSYGLATMTCCALLCITGVVDVATAFGGLTNKIVILMANMFVLSAAFSKTSFVLKLKNMMVLMNGKKGTLLVILMCLICAVMVQFMPCTASLALLFTFAVALGTEGDVTASRVMMPLLVVSGTFWQATPLGWGATAYATLNAQYEGIVQNEAYLLQILDKTKVAIIPAIFSVVYCALLWKTLPKYEVASAEAASAAAKKQEGAYTKAQEILVYVLFVAVMIVLIFFQSYSYIAPVIATLILAYSKTLSLKEITTNLSSSTTFMVAGILVISNCIGKTGAGAVIGNVVLKILGGTTNPVVILIVFAIATIVMTSLMSNIATAGVLIPIAASASATLGCDPRAIILVISISSYYAWLFPTASSQSGMVFAMAGYNPFSPKILRFTLPLLVLNTAVLIVSALIFFPL